MNLGIVAILILSFVCQASGSLSSCSHQNPGLFYANDEIYFVRDGHGYLKSSITESPKLIKRQSNSPVIAMTYDQIKKTLYYVEAENPKRIYSYDGFFSQEITFLDQDLEEFKELSIDLLTGNVYFISQHGIGFCNFKVKRCARLINCPSGSEMKSLIVIIAGQLNWIQTSSSNGLGGKVWRSLVDGLMPSEMLDFDDIVDIAYDTDNIHIYLTNGKEISRFSILANETHKISDTNSNMLFHFDCEIYNFKEWHAAPNPLLVAEKRVEPVILNHFGNPCEQSNCPGLFVRSLMGCRCV